MSLSEKKKENKASSIASSSSSEAGDDADSENYVGWDAVYEANEKGDLIACKLETDISEHIVASLLYWEKITKEKWFCVQVIRSETVSEDKRVLVLEIKTAKNEFSVKYFVAQEMGDKYFVEDFELTRQSKIKLAKVKLIGAKIEKK